MVLANVQQLCNRTNVQHFQSQKQPNLIEGTTNFNNHLEYSCEKSTHTTILNSLILQLCLKHHAVQNQNSIMQNKRLTTPYSF